MEISGQLVDLHQRSLYPAKIRIEGRTILSVERVEHAEKRYIMPGFTDAHIHIESSMVTPAMFARSAIRHGTVAAVADPHEIANVLGREGVEFMVGNAATVPLKYMFGAPSSVPATNFETSGASIGVNDVALLLDMPGVGLLSEVMNYPGVLGNDPELIGKIGEALKRDVPVDGHAPGLTGDDLLRYVSAGITTDHECVTIDEAREKIAAGMKILIREGSAAKNLEALHPLLKESPDSVMLCSDDLHPYDLQRGHINLMVKRLLQRGYDLFDVLRAASLNPVLHYNLPVGLLRQGDRADFIIVDDIGEIRVSETYIEGEAVCSGGETLFTIPGCQARNNFNCSPILSEEIAVEGAGTVRVIAASDGSLVTGELTARPPVADGRVLIDVENDILKIVVKDRYRDAPPVVAFINGFGLKRGAFASSVAHDSHNIVAVGADDMALKEAVNAVIEMKGGIAWADPGNSILTLQLEIGGIMSSKDLDTLSTEYEMINNAIKAAGSTLTEPCMTLSFMALLVIPELKIGDRGLFDVRRFGYVPLFTDND